MTKATTLKLFNEIYLKTHEEVEKYLIIKCHNINDINDLIQETYLEFWHILNKKEITNTNIKSYLIGIANNKIKKHFTFLKKISTISLFNQDDHDIELIDTLKDNFDLEDVVIQNDDWDLIWHYLKGKKNQDIPKIFYLYYKLDMSIREIAKSLQVKESYIKNLIYRTLKELQINLGGKK